MPKWSMRYTEGESSTDGFSLGLFSDGGGEEEKEEEEEARI